MQIFNQLVIVEHITSYHSELNTCSASFAKVHNIKRRGTIYKSVA